MESNVFSEYRDEMFIEDIHKKELYWLEILDRLCE